jgi:hypothetical protein
MTAKKGVLDDIEHEDDMHPVTDLATAEPLYSKLFGVAPYMDETYYVGFNVEGHDVGLDPHGHRKGMTSPVTIKDADGNVVGLLQTPASR